MTRVTLKLFQSQSLSYPHWSQDSSKFSNYQHNSFLINKRILELKIDNVEYFIKSKPSLRGGGCGESKINSEMHATIPINYI